MIVGDVPTPRADREIVGFCPECGDEMTLDRARWLVPDDDVHGAALLCSEGCARLWTGVEQGPGAVSVVSSEIPTKEEQ